MKNFLKKDQKIHYSPLRYPGGKTFLFPYFDKIINRIDLEKITYVEPYAGGAGAALKLLFLEKVENIVINDLDKAIFSFWKSAIFHSSDFIKKIVTTPITVEEWRKQKNIYKNSRSTQFDLGFSTFFLNRTNVSGILNGGPIGGLSQNGKWKISSRFYKKTLIERIGKLSLYKNRISVFNQDGIELIKKYINRKNAFIYLDPPYFEKGAFLYLNHYQKNDHEKLAKHLNSNTNANWLLTYDNCSEIKSLYEKRKIIKFSVNYNARNFRVGKEIMILSDALSGRRDVN